MEANELRIGNLVEWSRQHDIGASPEIVQIYNVALSSIRVYTDIEELPEILIYYDDVKPIPLTPEWLERAGFELFNTKSISEYSHKGCYGLKFTLYNGYITVLCKGVIISELKHVHQLQNLYFALTGKELEFNIQSKKHSNS